MDERTRTTNAAKPSDSKPRPWPMPPLHPDNAKDIKSVPVAKLYELRDFLFTLWGDEKLGTAKELALFDAIEMVEWFIKNG